MSQKDDWVAAAEAVKILVPRFSAYAATRRICERAHAGLVRARAEHFQLGDRSTENFDIPKTFWWAEGEAALTQDWTAGDFSTWIDDVQFKAFGVTFRRVDLEKLAPPADETPTIGQHDAGQSLYLQLLHLAETAPDITRDTTTDTRLWLAQVRAAIRQTEDTSNIATFEAALAMYSRPGGLTGGYGMEILQCLYNAVAFVGRNAPASMRGAFVPAGSAHDAIAAVGKILREAKQSVLLVDPYADASILERYALFAADGVAIEVLTDKADVKVTLKPAAEAWVKQYGTSRPLSVRLGAAKALHDRLIILDETVAYTVGQSFNALAARAPTSINRIIDAETARRKIEAHRQIWGAGTVLV